MDGSCAPGPSPAGLASLLPQHNNNAVTNGTPDFSAEPKAYKAYRPQAYMHLEFGLSWSQGHLPNSHSVAYQSKALHEQFAHHQLPPPPAQTQNTAVSRSPLHWDAEQGVYMRKILPTDAATARQRPTHRHSSAGPIPARPGQLLWGRHAAGNLQQPSRALTPVFEHGTSDGRRLVAKGIRSQRGRSEPPPENQSFWASPPLHGSSGFGGAPFAVTTQYATRNNRAVAHPSSRKQLPDVPARRRVGEDASHWSRAADDRIWQSATAASVPSIVIHVPETTPIVLPIQSPLPDAPRYREIDPKRRNDMQVLSEAMMWRPESQTALPSTHARTPSGGSGAARPNSVHHSIAPSESDHADFEEEALSEPGSPSATAWSGWSSAPLPPSSWGGVRTSTRALSTVSAMSAVSAVSAVSDAHTPGPDDLNHEQYVVSPISAAVTVVSPVTDPDNQLALFTRPRHVINEDSIMSWAPPGTAHSSTNWVQQPHPLVRADELFFDR